MKKESFYSMPMMVVWVSFFVAIFSLFGIAGYLLINKDNFVNYVPNEILEEDKKDEWQTYTNEEYGIEFKYPDYWNEVILIESKDWLDNSKMISFVFEDFPKRNNPDFSFVEEGVVIRIYEKEYSCAPDEYECAVLSCEEGFEGQTQYIRPADGGQYDYRINFCKKIDDNKFLPASITYSYFIEENETNNEIKNSVTLQRIADFREMVSTFEFKYIESADLLNNYPASFLLDCSSDLKTFEEKYDWCGELKEIVSEDDLNIACYNSELNKVVYLKSEIDFENYRNDHGRVYLGLLDLDNDKSEILYDRNLVFYENCSNIEGWYGDDILFKCAYGDGGFSITNFYSYNLNNDELNLIKSCDSETGREPEEVCETF